MPSKTPKTSEQLYRLMDMLDELHSAADFAGLTEAEIAATLREIIYTAQETLHEIHSHKVAQMPALRLVDKKIGKVG